MPPAGPRRRALFPKIAAPGPCLSVRLSAWRRHSLIRGAGAPGRKCGRTACPASSGTCLVLRAPRGRGHVCGLPRRWPRPAWRAADARRGQQGRAAEPSPLPPGANIWSGRPQRQWGGCRHCPRMRRENRGTAPGSGENLAAAPRRVGRGKSCHLRRSPVPPPKTPPPPASPSPRACVTVWQKRPCPSPVPLWSASPRQGSQGPHGPRR